MAVVEMATMLGVVEAVGGEGKKEHRVLPSSFAGTSAEGLVVLTSGGGGRSALCR